MAAIDQERDKSPIGTGGAPPGSVVAIRRRTVDAVLISLGAAAAVVLGVAGGLLTWGSSFADDYVHDELSSQRIFFADRAALEAEGRDDLVKYAGEQVTDGDEAEAYASYIDGHLQETAGGATYAELGAPQRAAQAALAEARESGASEDEIATLQAEADELTRQRETLFRGETLRGLLLSAFSWSTVGRIAGIAAIAAFIASGVMLILVILGLVHYRKAAQGT
jgi:hypothetical protein